MNLLDILTLLSYIALNIDIAFQMRQVYISKSSKNLSLVGLTIRYLAIIIILIKFLTLSDLSLIIGQGLILMTFTAYFALAFFYFTKRNNKH